MNIRIDLIFRVCIITAVFTILSYVIVQRKQDVEAIPILFIVFGLVVLISILYDISRFHAINPKPDAETKA